MITVSVKNQSLRLTRIDKVVSDTINYLTLQATFTDDWDGFTKTAHFKNADSVYDVVLDDDKITADKGMNLSKGYWSLYFSGTKDDVRITTNQITIPVSECGMIDGEPFPSSEVTDIETIVALAKENQSIAPTAKVEQIGTSAKITIQDKNGTTEAVIEKGDKGDKGDLNYAFFEINLEDGCIYETTTDNDNINFSINGLGEMEVELT